MWGLLEGWQVPAAPPSPEIRADLEARAALDGGAALYRELTGMDPEAARRIHSRNVRRVIRALEVRRTSGQSPAPMRKARPPFSPTIVGLNFDRAELYRRIDARLDAMIESGWIDEVRSLVERGYSLDLPSMSSHGYREIGHYLAGEITLYDAVQAVKSRIHRFARQQHAWFRAADERITWFDASSPDTALAHLASALDCS